MKWVVKKGEEYLDENFEWTADRQKVYVYSEHRLAKADAIFHWGRVVKLVPKRKLVSVPAGRAATNEAKWSVLLRIFNAWVRVKELRLGQAIVCAVGGGVSVPKIFFIEDEALVQSLEGLAKSLSK